MCITKKRKGTKVVYIIERSEGYHGPEVRIKDGDFEAALTEIDWWQRECRELEIHIKEIKKELIKRNEKLEAELKEAKKDTFIMLDTFVIASFAANTSITISATITAIQTIANI